MRQHLAKYERLFCSIALILHLCEVSPGPEVKAETAMRAAAWCQYLEGHARRTYSLLEAETATAARSLSRRLAAGKLPDGFTARDMQRKGWTGLDTTPLVDQALSVLEDHGHIAGQDYQHPAGGPQTIRYSINPALLKGGQK